MSKLPPRQVQRATSAIPAASATREAATTWLRQQLGAQHAAFLLNGIVLRLAVPAMMTGNAQVAALADALDALAKSPPLRTLRLAAGKPLAGVPGGFSDPLSFDTMRDLAAHLRAMLAALDAARPLAALGHEAAKRNAVPGAGFRTRKDRRSFVERAALLRTVRGWNTDPALPASVVASATFWARLAIASGAESAPRSAAEWASALREWQRLVSTG